MEKLNNIHPGEILKGEFLSPMGISQNQIAREIGVPPLRINEIILGKGSVTANTALRLARYFGTQATFWMGLQAEYDLREALRGIEDYFERNPSCFCINPRITQGRKPL